MNILANGGNFTTNMVKAFAIASAIAIALGIMEWFSKKKTHKRKESLTKAICKEVMRR